RDRRATGAWRPRRDMTSQQPSRQEFAGRVDGEAKRRTSHAGHGQPTGPSRKMSGRAFVSRWTRSRASEKNATQRPSAEMHGSRLRRSPCRPAEEMLTRLVVSETRLWTKMSYTVFVSPVTTFGANEANATVRPVPEMLPPSAYAPSAPTCWAPPVATLTRVSVCATRSATNTSSMWLVSPATRLAALLSYTTYRPSDDMLVPWQG